MKCLVCKKAEGHCDVVETSSHHSSMQFMFFGDWCNK